MQTGSGTLPPHPFDSTLTSTGDARPSAGLPTPPATPRMGANADGPTRVYVGLAVLGWGISILVGAAPHEDPVVGAALLAFGAILVATAPRLPTVDGVPAWVLGLVGMSLVVALAAGMAYFDTGWNAAKVAIATCGLALVACAPLVRAHAGFHWRGQRVGAAALAAMLLVMMAAPLVVWGSQAAFKHASGSTPVEVFVAAGLVVPLAWFLSALGLHSVAQGQDLVYTTTRGPLTLHVGAACSGVEAMAVFTAVLGMFCIIERPGGRALGVWSAIGLLGVYVANLARLAVVALVGYAWGIDALLWVHAEAGWIFFVAWALVFSWLVRRRSRRTPGAASTSA
jgi:exosortase/archaeosortase family protein